MKLALEALERGETELRWQAISALKEALAQPEQEPVAQCTESDSWNCKYCRKTESCKALQDPRNFASPQPAQQEPVAYIHRQGNHYEVSERFLSDDEKARGWTEEPLYTSPPTLSLAQRTWVGLADDEIYSVLENLQVMYNRPPTMDSRVIFARAIEAKLKEKNT